MGVCVYIVCVWVWVLCAQTFIFRWMGKVAEDGEREREERKRVINVSVSL